MGGFVKFKVSCLYLGKSTLDLTLVTLKGQVKDKVIDFNLCILERVAHKLLLSTADYTFHGIDIPWVDDLSLH